MRILTYRRGGTDRAGVETGDGILDAGELLGEHSVTVRQLLAGDRLGDLADAAEDGKASSLSGEVEPRPPALVTPDEAGEHDSISFQLELNGERMQDAVASDLIFSPPGASVPAVGRGDDGARGHRLHGHAVRGGQRARAARLAAAGGRGRDQLAHPGAPADAADESLLTEHP